MTRVATFGQSQILLQDVLRNEQRVYDGQRRVTSGIQEKDYKGFAIDVTTLFASFEDYWRPFLGGQGPAPAYAMALDEPMRARLRDAIRGRIPLQPDGSISLTARAWAIRAAVPS